MMKGESPSTRGEKIAKTEWWSVKKQGIVPDSTSNSLLVRMRSINVEEVEVVRVGRLIKQVKFQSQRNEKKGSVDLSLKRSKFKSPRIKSGVRGEREEMNSESSDRVFLSCSLDCPGER
eukprot:Pompholyxophrys_punicea_v1_NODE_223_length_2692_cov_17.711794.p2 type:complete len:119 gc:universal NODE_223_length_2692_cov_17.711794:2104-2460(+)